MSSTPQSRKISVIAEEPEILKLLRVLSRKPDLKRPGAPNLQACLGKISHKDFDRVLLDLRCSSRNRRSPSGVGAIKRIRPNLLGRVLSLTIEVSDPLAMDLVERYLADDLPKSLLWLLGESNRANPIHTN